MLRLSGGIKMKKLNIARILSLVLALLMLTPLAVTAAPQSEGSYNNWTELALAMEKVLNGVKDYYKAGDATEAFNQMNRAYYNFYEIEGFEKNAKAHIKASRKTEVEFQFSQCKTSIKQGEPQETVDANVDTLISMLKEDADALDIKFGYKTEGSETAETGDEAASAAGVSSAGGSLSSGSTNPWLTFGGCFAIILREGFEAILVVGAIIAYLVKSGNKNKLGAVYLGSVLAIICSFAAAVLLTLLKWANGANQEIIEGITALIAVVVLFYVSNWMVSKAESEAWSRYIEGQLSHSVETGSMFTLGFTAFLAVFREGAEVILFYQPFLSEEGQAGMVFAGFGAGCLVLIVVYLAIRYLSVKLPMKPFFLGTSILMFILSIAFLGSGIKELIEGDVFMMTSPAWLKNLIPTNDVLDMLGIYPCYETLIPQMLLLTLTVIIFAIQGWKRNNKVEAGILAILFGGLGIHKFYVGKYGQGIVYAIFCWTLIPSVLGIVEGIHFICGTDEEFEAGLKV